jgi:hypothetical protein
VNAVNDPQMEDARPRALLARMAAPRFQEFPQKDRGDAIPPASRVIALPALHPRRQVEVACLSAFGQTLTSQGRKQPICFGESLMAPDIVPDASNWVGEHVNSRVQPLYEPARLIRVVFFCQVGAQLA